LPHAIVEQLGTGRRAGLVAVGADPAAVLGLRPLRRRRQHQAGVTDEDTFLLRRLASPGPLAAEAGFMAGAAVPDPADPGDRAAFIQQRALLQLHRRHAQAAAGGLVTALVRA